MKIEQILKQAFAMPLTSPSYPPIEFKFTNREFLIIAYETDIDALREVVPEPLEVYDPIVKFEFIKMPDSVGFGDYTESGQVIPVKFNGKKGSYVHSMYLDDLAPIVAGREIWGFPKKLANPKLEISGDTLVGTLNYNKQPVAIGTMGYKYQELDIKDLKTKIEQEPNYLLKILPDVDGTTARVCELVEYHIKNLTIKGAWSGPAALQLFEHALAPVARLPVKRIISGTHIVSDLTLGFGTVVYDYLKK
ncbi:MAG: acetoacetate decarboxylase [Burkholderiales bacterium]|jgi:acetoacetate decarboxylase|nr:acetoacetate decarboxylase [Burkholderiales bacterium]